MARDPGPNGRLPSLLPAPELSFPQQYEAGMRDAVLIDRSELTILDVTGADSERFLHNLLSASVSGLSEGAGTEATLLNNKGKLVAVLTVLRDGERFRLVTESIRATALRDGLDRFIIADDVTLELRPLDDAALSVEGPKAARILAEALGENATSLERLGHLGHRRYGSLHVVSRRHDPSPRFDLFGSGESVTETMKRCLAAGASVGDEQLAEIRRIEAGRPRFGVDIDDSHMPLEASLDEALDFDKGCYIGQEYVVRLAHRGQLQKKLVGILIEGSTPPDLPAPVHFEDRHVGLVTSARYSPCLDAVAALGFVKRDAFAPGTRVEVGSEGSSRSADVTETPFVTTEDPAGARE